MKKLCLVLLLMGIAGCADPKPLVDVNAMASTMAKETFDDVEKTVTEVSKKVLEDKPEKDE